MKNLLLVLCFACSAGASAQAEEHCSLLVKLVDPTFKEIGSPEPVVVEEGNGHQTRERNGPGGTSFCGLGITPVSVTVGYSSCEQIVVRDVSVSWDKTRTLYVNYDPKQCDTGEPGREHNVPDLTCRFLFRVVDPESAPIRGAHLDYYQADQYGRIYIEGQLSLRGSKSNELEGTVAADGFEPTEVRAVCAGGLNGKMTIEQFVMLRRLNSGQ